MLGSLKLTRKQCCQWSCGIALAIALIMPPIAIFVITPVIAQAVMYGTEIALPNSTIFPCSGLNAWMLNTAKIHVPGPFGATLHPYETIISTTICIDNSSGTPQTKAGTSCDNSIVTVLGTYLAPEMKLQAGHNIQEFVVGMALKDSTTVTSGFVMPMFFAGAKTELTIESRSIDMVASLNLVGIDIGIKVKSMKLFNKLTCSKVVIHDYQEIPDTICHPNSTMAAKPTATITRESAATMTGESSKASLHHQSLMGRRLDAGSGYEIVCVPGAPQKPSMQDSLLNIFA